MINEEAYKKEVKDFLLLALSDLAKAKRKMTKQTVPYTPLGYALEELPFEFVPGKVFWPKICTDNQDVDFDTARVRPLGPNLSGTDYALSAMLAEEMAELCGYEPEKIVEAQQATTRAEAWCLAQKAQREAEALSILQSQMKYLEIIEKSHGSVLWTGPRILVEEKPLRRALEIGKKR